ncbi:unnamed protein product [Schistosoma intercalatum]|nr:unnamed protein product [Schistosoma intercalatum]CAH8583796.1 unnamed protein product [Schistosoma intercalatum]
MDLTILSAPDECLPCDPECLLIFCYIRLKGARMNIKMKVPDQFTVESFPVLSHDNKDYHRIPIVLTYLRKELYSLAKLCITSLAYILGENTYFIGDRPTAVDAYVFALMWPLLMYESQHGDSNWWDIDYNSSSSTCLQSGSHHLITHLLQCPNLMRFFKNISSKYFQKHTKCFRKEKSSVIDKSVVSHPIRDCILWGTGVVGLFLTYAYCSNNLRILQRFHGSRST